MADIVSEYFLSSDSVIECFVIEEKKSSNKSFKGRPIYQINDFFELYDPSSIEIFVAISYHEQNKLREKYFKKFDSKKYRFASYVSRHAVIQSDVIVGRNCLILEGTVIQKTCVVNDNSFIWTGVQIGHHSKILENSFIGSGSVLMGCNIIGKNSHISASTTIKDHINVGKNTYTAIGSVII